MRHGIQLPLRAPKRSWLAEQATWSVEDEGEGHWGLELEGTERLLESYFRFIWKTVPETKEWPATTGVLQAISACEDAIQLYGRQREGRSTPNWHLVVLFGGDGGMAQVRMQVAAHWAMIWYDSTPAFHRLLAELGLAAKGPAQYVVSADISDPPGRFQRPPHRLPRFVPLESPGCYAAQVPNWKARDEAPYEFDLAWEEELEGGLDDVLAMAVEQFGKTPDGCYCQLCAPRTKRTRRASSRGKSKHR